MKYFFFQTLIEECGGEAKTRLRALPGQTFEDGSPVSTTLNVQAPKEPGSSPYGSRMEYPLGTYFASDHLETSNSESVIFYTVYLNLKKTPNFHPVADTPDFRYVAPEHEDAKMNAAFALFKAGIDPFEAETGAEEESGGNENQAAIYTPADENGIARAADPNWKERYQGQIEEESQMFGKWLRGLFSERGVPLPNRIVMNTVQDTFEKLYKTGESIDTLASRTRFDAFLKAEKICFDDFAILKDGPLKKYISWIEKEHDSRKVCSAQKRDVQIPGDLGDAVTMISDAHCSTTGFTSVVYDQDRDNIKKAFEAGWELNDLIDPENLKKGKDIREYAEKLATGAIPLPEKFIANEASYIDMLLSDKKNRKPRDKDGFHVDERVWKILLENLNRKRNTLLTGPSGSGKTEIVRRLCEQTGTPFTIIQMGSITDPTEQLVGKMDIDSLTGGTVFDWADFALAIQKPGVVLLDEVNRIPKNGENTLFSCLDGTRELSAAGAKTSDRRTIKVNPDCCFFATANIGDEFTGTKQIDGALKTRFMQVELDYMTQGDEVKILMARTGVNKDDATNIAFVANKIRTMARKGEVQVSISTRETITCAELVHDGFSVLDAIGLTFLPLYDAGYGNGDSNSERTQIKQVISQRFGNRKA